jgi:TupA-like ATPgrasp
MTPQTLARQAVPQRLLTRLGRVADRATGRDVRLRAQAAALAEREAEIERLRAEVRRHQQVRKEQERLRTLMAPLPTRGNGRPSWQAYLRQWQRQYMEVIRLDGRDRLPHWRLPRKLFTYRLAASHGVRVPEVYAVWRTLGDIDLSGLPDDFVLKSDRGSTSQGVLPLRRRPDGYELVSTEQVLDEDGPREHLTRRREQGKVGGPYFAEELLDDGSGSALPHDVKVYAFYGEVAQVLVRAVPAHGETEQLRKRYVLPDGADLAEDYPLKDASVPLPTHFEETVEVARRLSRAVPFPFVRVDLYDTPGGITMGELTQVPGGIQCWSLDRDTELGRMAEQAKARLFHDLALGRPFDFVWGEHPYEEAVPPVRG